LLTIFRYNDSESTRGYPDLSANGVNTLYVHGGVYTLTGGTSASAPTVGGIVTLINEQHIKAGKSTVGFINPVLYANPHAFNDIEKGNNPGCGTDGYEAVPGWDPITGLGTPNCEKLLRVFMALP
jgi:tripeptidyl-peptidase I